MSTFFRVPQQAPPAPCVSGAAADGGWHPWELTEVIATQRSEPNAEPCVCTPALEERDVGCSPCSFGAVGSGMVAYSAACSACNDHEHADESDATSAGIPSKLLSLLSLGQRRAAEIAWREAAPAQRDGPCRSPSSSQSSPDTAGSSPILEDRE